MSSQRRRVAVEQEKGWVYPRGGSRPRARANSLLGDFKSQLGEALSNLVLNLNCSNSATLQSRHTRLLASSTLKCCTLITCDYVRKDESPSESPSLLLDPLPRPICLKPSGYDSSNCFQSLTEQQN